MQYEKVVITIKEKNMKKDPIYELYEKMLDERLKDVLIDEGLTDETIEAIANKVKEILKAAKKKKESVKATIKKIDAELVDFFSNPAGLNTDQNWSGP